MNKVGIQAKRVSEKERRDLVQELYEPRIRAARMGFAMNRMVSIDCIKNT
jgi:hypothetical protein